MAVPESSPPVPPLPNNVKLLAQTVVPSAAVHRAVLARVRQSDIHQTVLTSESHISVATKCDATESDLRVIYTQPVHGTLLDLEVMQFSKWQPVTNKKHTEDAIVLLTADGCISLLHFDSCLHRFIKACQHKLDLNDRSKLLPAQKLVANLQQSLIAVVGYNWVTVLQSVCVAERLDVSQACTLSALPAMDSEHAQWTPVTSSQQFLPAQTDSRDRGLPLPKSPTGIICNACFVDVSERAIGSTLCSLAVLYHVGPEESCWVLDIISYPQTNLVTSKPAARLLYRLQQHSTADRFPFLKDAMATDICAFPMHQSGIVVIFDTGIMVLDLGDVQADMDQQTRVECQAFDYKDDETMAHTPVWIPVLFANHWNAAAESEANCSAQTQTDTESAVPNHVGEIIADSQGVMVTSSTAEPSGLQHRAEPVQVDTSDVLKPLQPQTEYERRTVTCCCWHRGVASTSDLPSPVFSAQDAQQHSEKLLIAFGDEGASLLSLSVATSLAAGGLIFSIESDVFSPSSPPLTMLTLPDGNLLLGTTDGDSCVLGQYPGHGKPVLGSLLHSPAPVWDFTVANPQQLPQAQVYAACGQRHNGSIRVMHADQTVEVLHESEADYPGMSGMWSLPPWPGADTHSLVVLSFASSSRAMASGTTLRDVTEAVGLVANKRTLACACLADCLAVQVMRRGMHLFNMDTAFTPNQSELSCSPSGDRSRARLTRLSEPPTLEDLDISAADDHFTDRSPVPARPTVANRFTPDPLCSSYPLADLTPDSEAGSPQASQERGYSWRPPGGATISTAAATDDIVIAACTHFKGLVALQAVLTDGTFPGQMQKASTTNSPGKRKRGRKRWTLQELARASLPDEVSCIHIVPYTAGGQACKLVAVGTYKPSLQLMLLQPGNPAQPMSQTPFFHPVVSVDIAPLLQVTLPTPAPLDPMAVLSGPEAAANSTGTKLEARGLEYMPEQIVPESIQLLNADSGDTQLQVLVGLRSGTLVHLSCSRLEAPTAANSSVHHDSPQLQLITTMKLDSLPVVLVPLPTAVGLMGISLALGDRLALLRIQPGSGRVGAAPLAMAGVLHAVPLWQPAALAAGSGNSRFSMLCALSSGKLQLVDLLHYENPHTQHLQLPPPGRPALVKAHPDNVLIVAVERDEFSWELCCMDCMTGKILARYPMAHGECISALHIWQTTSWTQSEPKDLPTAAQLQSGAGAQPADAAKSAAHVNTQSQDALQLTMRAGSAAAAEAVQQQEEEPTQSVAALQQQPDAMQQRTDAMQQGTDAMLLQTENMLQGTEEMQRTAGMQEELQQQQRQHDQKPVQAGAVAPDESTGVPRVYIVVSTKDRRLQWNPCKGRILLLQLSNSEPGVWLETVVESKFRDEVHAVTVLPNQSRRGLGSNGVLVASIGRSLISFREQQGRLRRLHLFACSQPITCLSANATQGHFSASNDTDSVMIFRHDEQLGFQMLHADRYSRPITHSCITQQPRPSDAAVAAVSCTGQVVFLDQEPQSYSHERNMYTAAHHSIGQRTAGIACASLLQPPGLSNFHGMQRQGHPLEAVDLFPRLLQQDMSEDQASSSVFHQSGHMSPPAQHQHRAFAVSRVHDSNLPGSQQQATATAQSRLAASPSNMHQSSALTAALSASPLTHESTAQQQQGGVGGSSWVVVTTAGDVIQISSITSDQHQVLTALQAVMTADGVTAPLSGCTLQQDSGTLQPGQGRQQQESRAALDGDLLSQYLQLPVADQQRLLEALRLPGSQSQASREVLHSVQLQFQLQHLISVLEVALSMC